MYRDSKQLLLVMQRPPRVQLDSVWPLLTESEKDDIIVKPGRTFGAMRQAGCPWDDFFGSLEGGRMHHYLFYSQRGGPFYSQIAFVTGLTGNFRSLSDRNGRPDFKVRSYGTYFARVLQGHQPILTHGDVLQRNIIVVENTGYRNDRGSIHLRLYLWIGRARAGIETSRNCFAYLPCSISYTGKGTGAAALDSFCKYGQLRRLQCA